MLAECPGAAQKTSAEQIGHGVFEREPSLCLSLYLYCVIHFISLVRCESILPGYRENVNGGWRRGGALPSWLSLAGRLNETSHQELSEQLAQIHVVIELAIQLACHETETGLAGVPVLDASLHGNALLLSHDVSFR